jgi:multidrug efflux system membrane fusion protein
MSHLIHSSPFEKPRSACIDGSCAWLPRPELKPARGATTCPARDAELFAGEYVLSVRRRLLAVAGLFLFTSTAAIAQGGPPAMPVSVAPPVAKRVTQWDEYSGKFEAVASVEVRARVSGFIDKLHFKDGQLVEVGDPLFTIDKRPFEIAVDSAEAEVLRNKAQVNLAELQVERGASLIKSKTITEAENDQRKANLAVARAQLKAAEAAVRSAELNLDWTDVRAPVAGRISDRKVDAGNLIQGGQQGATLLATIVTLDPIRFVFDVSEADYLRYTRLFLSGALASSRDLIPVRIRLADETEWTRHGKVDFVDNTLSARSGTIRTRAVVENKNQLLTPNIFGRVQLFGGEYDALLIPDSAVVSDQSRKIVFTVGANNVVQAKPVTLGPIVDGLRVVRDGLAATDQVVLDGLANPMVRPGAKIVPQKGEITTAKAK